MHFSLELHPSLLGGAHISIREVFSLKITKVELAMQAELYPALHVYHLTNSSHENVQSVEGQLPAELQCFCCLLSLVIFTLGWCGAGPAVGCDLATKYNRGEGTKNSQKRWLLGVKRFII